MMSCETLAPSLDVSVSEHANANRSEPKNASYKIPWVEKYRPRMLDDVLGNEDTIIRLRAIAKDGNMPNLILSGPPGTGKTTSVHALAHELLGMSYKDAVLELNASDARGIDVVRNKIKSFAMNKVTLPPGRHKIIILDEADSMTNAAQQALRRTMELYSNSTRFCLACNVSTKIIEAIQSRAAILRFSRLTNEQVLQCLLKVCEAENISYCDDGLEAILFTAEGDMRNALNTLQASCNLSKDGIINQTTVFKVCDQPHPKILGEIIYCCTKGDTNTAVAKMYRLHQSGYSASDIIGTTFKVVKAYNDLSEAMKLEYLREVGFTHMRIADGVDTVLQLIGLVARLSAKAQVLKN